MGTITSDTGSFPTIKCPRCHEETYNFDTAATVERNDKEEGYSYDYKLSTFDIAS
jgi:hypothetical protein